MSKAFLPAAIWWLVLTYCSLTTVPELPKFDLFSLDKLIHFGIYGLLNLFFLGGWRRAGKTLSIKVTLYFTLFAMAWGILIEYIQGTLSYRTFEYDDMIANTIGAILSIPFYWIARRVGILT